MNEYKGAGTMNYENTEGGKSALGFDLEAMLAACVPGGSICDPQQVADAIRDYFAAAAVAVDHGDLMELIGEFGRCVRDEPTKAGAVLHEIHQRIAALGVPTSQGGGQ
jgi:hypothetical protein